jgi:hypothetical protein
MKKLRIIFFIIICNIPTCILSQEKQIFSGDFMLLNIEIRYSDDNFSGGRIIIFLDSNIEKHTFNELLFDLMTNQKVFYNKILNYPKIDFDKNCFYYNKANKKSIIDDSFYKLAEQPSLDSSVCLSKSLEVYDSWVKRKVYYTYTIKRFFAKGYFVKHELNKDFYGCYRLSLSEEGYLFFTYKEYDKYIYFPIKELEH